MIKIFNKNKSFSFIVLFLLIFLILLTGTTYSQNEDLDLKMEKIKTPTEIKDFLELFTKFEFTLVEKEEGKIINENHIKINYEGEKIIEDTKTDKVTIIGEGTAEVPLVEFWFKKNENKLTKFVADGQELPVAMANNVMDDFLQAAFYPFIFYKRYNLGNFEEFDSADISKKTKSFSGKEYEITEIKMDDLKEYGLKSGVMQLAEFNDFILVVYYDLVTQENDNLIYNVDNIELK